MYICRQFYIESFEWESEWMKREWESQTSWKNNIYEKIACNQLLNVSHSAHYTRKYQKAKKIHVKYVRDSILQFVAECAWQNNSFAPRCERFLNPQKCKVKKISRGLFHYKKLLSLSKRKKIFERKKIM